MTSKAKSVKSGGEAGSRKKSPVAEVRTGLPQMMRSTGGKSSGKSSRTSAKSRDAEPLRGGGAKKRK